MSYRNSWIEGCNKNEVVDKVMSMLLEQEPFENIICTGNSQVVKKGEMLKFIEEHIIHKFDLEDFKKYFFRYYYIKYNTTYILRDDLFGEFWKEQGIIWQENQGYDTLHSIAKLVFNEIYIKWAYIPQSYINKIDECICNGIVLEEEECRYKKFNISRERFIGYYLIHKYSEDKLVKYISKVSKSYIEENPNIDAKKLMNNIFKTRANNKITQTYMYQLYHLTIKATFKYTFKWFSLKRASELAKKFGIPEAELDEYYYSVRWKEADTVQKEWSNYTPKQLEIVFKEVNNIFLRDRDKFAKIRILEKMYGISKEMSERYRDKIFDRVPNTIEINKLISYYNEEQPKQLVIENIKEMEKGNKIWKLYANDKNTIRSIIMDFSLMPRSIRDDIQDYIKHNYDRQYTKLKGLNDVIIVLNKIINRFAIDTLRELTNEKLLIILHEFNRVQYSGNTRRRYIYVLNALYTHLNTTPRYRKNPLENPTINTRLANVAVNTKHVEYIPLEVRYAIEKHLDELDSTTRLCYRILSETGLRFSDQMETEVTDIVLENRHIEENERYARFYYISSKTKNSRIKSNTFEKRFAHITYSLYLEIKKYIDEFEVLRTELKTNKLLVNKNQKGKLCSVQSKKIITDLNKLINKYNITTEDGKLWRFTTKQLRKAMAVDLISNGASLHSVQSALGHTTPRTTEILILCQEIRHYKRRFSS